MVSMNIHRTRGFLSWCTRHKSANFQNPTGFPRGSQNMEAIQHAHRLWSAIDLNQRKAQMDSQSLEIADQQEAFANSRKRLAEQTRGYKKAGPEEKAQLIGSLIKLYQEEIDGLTKRCKFAETWFLEWYKDLTDLPDPATILNHAIELNSSLLDDEEKDEEIKNLQEELSELKKDLQKVRNQDVTIRQLEDQIKEATAKTSQTLQNELALREKQWSEENARLIQSQKERESQLLLQLLQKEESIKQNIKLAEESQSMIIELRLKHEEEREKLQLAYDMSQAQNERTIANLLTVERERDKLLVQIDILKKQAQDAAMQRKSDLEADMEKKNHQLQELVVQISRMQNELVEEQRKATSSFEKAHKLSTEVESLRTELASRPTKAQFMEIRKKLKLLQALEFNGSVDEDDQIGDADFAASPISSVENILLEKHKKSTAELTNVKVQLSEAHNQVRELMQLNQTLQEKATGQEALIRQLEADLASSNLETQSREITPSTPKFAENTAPATPSPKLEPSADSQQDNKNSILSIITQQRDRFHKRVAELELENKKLKDSIETHKTAATNLQSDNIKLYEKIRYLQTFNTQKQDPEAGEDAVGVRYRTLYEESIHPFAQFNTKERQQRYQQLNMAERIILHTSTFLLGHKRTRVFVFCYIILLHFLVFSTISAFASYTCPMVETLTPTP